MGGIGRGGHPKPNRLTENAQDSPGRSEHPLGGLHHLASLMPYKLYYTRQAVNDWETLKRYGKPSLVARARRLLVQIEADPFAPNPPYKKLTKDWKGLYANRLNLKHRLVYEVIEQEKAIKVVSLLTHYGD